MMASMHDAKRYYNAKAEAGTLDLDGRPTFDVVMTVCPVFHHDMERLADILAHYCDVSVLNLRVSALLHTTLIPLLH